MIPKRPTWVKLPAVWRVAAVAALASPACERTPEAVPEPGVFEVRDSAGVRIVEHSRIPQPLPRWSVSDTAEVTIGSVQGGTDGLSTVSSVASMPDGTILVVDSRALALRAFDGDGRYLWTAGGSGEGPGEFGSLMGAIGSISGAAFRGDSAIVYDRALRRFSVFDRRGEFSRTFRPEGIEEGLLSPDFVGALPGGEVVTRTVTWTSSTSGDDREAVSVYVHDAEGRSITTHGPLLGRTIRIDPQDRGNRYIGSFTPDVVAVIGGGRLHIGSQDQIAVRTWTGHDAPEQITRVRSDPIPFDPEARGRWIEASLALVTDPQIRARAAERYQGLPEFLPPFRGLMADGAGRVWIEPRPQPMEGGPSEWWIFAPDGEAIGMAAIPNGFLAHEVGRDFVLGVVRDELGVPYVERRRLSAVGP